MTSWMCRKLQTALLLFGLLPVTIGWVACGDDDTDEDCAWVARSELLPGDTIVRWLPAAIHLPDNDQAPVVLDPYWDTFRPVQGVTAIPSLYTGDPPRKASLPNKARRPQAVNGNDWACIPIN